MKTCNVCEQDIHRSSLANHLRTDGQLPKAGERIKCDLFCRLFVQATEIVNRLVCDLHIKNLTKALNSKMRCETFNKDNKENFYETHLRTEAHIDNLKQTEF